MIRDPRSSDSQYDPVGDYEDTVTLLQEEIVRLQEELRASHQSSIDEGEATPHNPDIERDFARRIAGLTSELARRDETIAQLFDQIRALDEAEVATKNEWDQLESWVREVELRVELRDRADKEVRRELEELRQAKTPAGGDDAERRAWEAERLELQAEVQRLRNRLEVVPSQSMPAARSPETAELERDIQDLRASLELSRESSRDAEALRFEVDSLRARLAESESSLRLVKDELTRQQNEHQVALASLQSSLAVAALSPATTPTPATPDAVPEEMSTEDRMWAFRSHLQEVHLRELEERKNRKLSARLSKLWNRTGAPGRGA